MLDSGRGLLPASGARRHRAPLRSCLRQLAVLGEHVGIEGDALVPPAAGARRKSQSASSAGSTSASSGMPW